MNKIAGIVLFLTIFVVVSCQIPDMGRGERPTPYELTKEELAKAGTIGETILGPAPASTHHRRISYIPNGSSWNVLIPYSREYVGPGHITSFNVDEKLPRHVTLGYIPPHARTPNDPVYDIKYSPRLGQKRFVYRDRVVMPMQAKYINDIILTYDIASNTFQEPFVIPHDDFIMLVADANAEGIIRASGHTRGGENLWFYQYNPFTKELKMSSKYPIEHAGISDYCYEMTRAVGDWIIVGWGSDPWRLVGYNFRTGVWKKFREIPGKGSYKTFRMFKQKDQSILIFSEEIFDDPSSMKYWRFRPTTEGEFLPTDVREREQYTNLDRHPLEEQYPYLEPGHYYHSAVSSTVSPPLIEEKSVFPAPDGRVEVRYSYKGAEESLLTNVPPFKTECKIVGHGGDYLFGAAGDYGEHIFYNIKSGRSHIFDGSNISVYSMKAIGEKVYMAGYPNFILREYDLSTMSMKDIGHNSYVKTHRPIAGIERGSDGKIYYAGQYYRTRDGGGIAWYDPATGEMGGLPIDRYRPFWMAAVRGGRYMVMSCKEDGGTFATYDVADSTLTITPIKDLFPGQIVSVGDHIIGYGTTPAEGHIIYRLDPIARKMLWKFKVPYEPVTAVSPVRKKEYILTYDGERYLYVGVGRYLLRVDIETVDVKVLGKLSSSSNITLFNGSIYQAGRKGFARLSLP